jgi:hypothetical protein
MNPEGATGQEFVGGAEVEGVVQSFRFDVKHQRDLGKRKSAKGI